jgi:hypothetical protein
MVRHNGGCAVAGRDAAMMTAEDVLKWIAAGRKSLGYCDGGRGEGQRLSSTRACGDAIAIGATTAFAYSGQQYVYEATPRSASCATVRPDRRHQRFHFHFTPTSASWLNAVEGFFAKLTRRRLKRGVFT